MRKILAALAVATLAGLALPANAGAPNPQGGTGSLSCNDGTVTWSPTNLWPPNHKLRNISISYAESGNGEPDGDQISIDVGSITELPASTDVSGAGQPTAKQGPDWTGANSTGTPVADTGAAVPSSQVRLRSERSGHDTTGRTYVIPVTCHDRGGTDSENDDQTVNLCVTVPHDQAHPAVPAASCLPS